MEETRQRQTVRGECKGWKRKKEVKVGSKGRKRRWIGRKGSGTGNNKGKGANKGVSREESKR